MGVTESVREHLERILASYDQIGTRFASMGGVTKVLGLLEDVRRELDHVSENEIERVTSDIKQVVEGLLKIDYELRKIQNLKLLFDQRSPHETRPLSGIDRRRKLLSRDSRAPAVDVDTKAASARGSRGW